MLAGFADEGLQDEARLVLTRMASLVRLNTTMVAFAILYTRTESDETRKLGRSLRGVVLTNLAKQLPRRPLAKAREARFVDEGDVVAIFWLK